MKLVNLNFYEKELNQSYKKMEFTKTEKGKVSQSIGNLVIALMNPYYCKKQGVFKGQIFWDNFSNEIKLQGYLIGEKGFNKNSIRLWDDAMNNRLGLEIEKRFKINYNSNKMWEAVRFVAGQYSISPPKEYLKFLKWNSDEDNIRKLLPKYLGAEDTELNRWIMEHMLIGMVSRVFNPGCKLDEMMILVGGQGIGKSTFVQKLAISPAWYCALQSIEGKDTIMNLMGKTVVEIEEFVALRNARSANEAKAFLSKLNDRIRIPYDRTSKDVPRTCILIGTLNERTFLNDHTGERRYLPVECYKDRIEKSVYYHEDYAAGLSKEEYERKVDYDFEQAIAQAVSIYKSNNYDMNIPVHLAKSLDSEQEKFKYINPDVEDLRYFLEEYKPRTALPHITCFKELTMAGFTLKSKAFSEIMENYFIEWKSVRLPKTERIKPNGVSIPVKVYYEREIEIPEEWKEEKKDKLSEQISIEDKN
ncbi:MAG: VapE domain-containing protein [Peptoniphilaceae bacterium]